MATKTEGLFTVAGGEHWCNLRLSCFGTRIKIFDLVCKFQQDNASEGIFATFVPN